MDELPQDYVALVKERLSTRHIAQRRLQELLGNRLHGGPGHGQPISFEPGLTAAEFEAIERQCGFRFPPDLRSLLAFMLPIHPALPNWREDAAAEVQWSQQDLLTGIWDDIDHYASWSPPRWSPAWGPMPGHPDTAWTILYEQFTRAPRLIRVYGHRFVPDFPAEAGNPVFSIVQSDIIHYGNDLADYFANEFKVPRPAWAARAPKEIPFWSDLVRLNDG